ncbi:MAG: response regulator [bacterium]|nr:MAG: response regulator [bacterium]
MSWKPLVYIITSANNERVVLRAQLLGADYNVTAFHDASEALRRLADGVPHIIIMERKQVAEDNGPLRELMDRLEEAAPLPVLYVMDSDEETPPGNLRDGLDDTLMRPVKSLELIARVRSLLRNRQLLSQIRIQENFLSTKGIRPFTVNERPPRVLLVEDETGERENISRLLEQMPCQVIRTLNPSEALWHVQRQTPQLVIVDLLFPDLDGLELCRYLKKQAETRYIPLLMLTAVPELDNRIMGMESGPDDYLVKPVNTIEVVTRVRRLLDRNAGHQKLLGNNQLLNRHGYTDSSTGIPRQEFFRFVYPEMVNWSQRAQLPFTIARIRIASEENFLKIAGEIRSILRNFDLDFITGETDLSLILPETPASRAQIALSRISARAEEMGVPPWEMRMVTVSIGEEGWDVGDIQEALSARPHRAARVPDPGAAGHRIVVAGNGTTGEGIAQFLRSHGFDEVQTVALEEGRVSGRIKANLVVLQGDLEMIPEMMDRLVPYLARRHVPILIKYTGPGREMPSSSIPDTADYIPPGVSDEYFLHRVRNSLDMALLRSGSEEVEQFLKRLIRLLEEGDTDVQGHGQQVSNWAVALGARLGLKKDQIEALRWGGLLHDVGKIFMPGRIITKEGMLSAEEFTIVKSHARLGYDLCRAFSMLDSALPIIKHHHERMDGEGYPEGLRGEKIPLIARIVSVVDVYDTLTRRRPYRPAFSPEESGQILRSEAEKGLWDGAITEEFLKMLEE